MNELIAQLRSITDRDSLDRWADSHIRELYEHAELRMVLRQKRNEIRNVANIRAEAIHWYNTVQS
jgi:hypothetical protein